MSDLFKKFNTLVRAQLESLMEDDLRLPVGRRSKQPSGPRTARDIKLLREQINAALDREEELQTELDALHQDASDLDQQANAALQSDDEATARQAVTRLRQIEQQITMAEADLTNHRHMTAALMDQVNILDSQLAAEQAQSAPPPPAPSEPISPAASAPAEEAESAPPAQPEPKVVKVPIVVEISEEAEETQDVSQIVEPSEPSPAPASPTSQDDDDLDARRARLARRDSHKEE